ncbi:hypothetical protein J6590_003477 [Homalodisca vitripennis]|nr:hypothetical protein J6590_003477 [Homalodisca vitripennis]
MMFAGQNKNPTRNAVPIHSIKIEKSGKKDMGRCTSRDSTVVIGKDSPQLLSTEEL